MKKKIVTLLPLIILLMTVFSLQSCIHIEPTYTILTDTETYDEFMFRFQARLEDGFYVREYLTGAQWEDLSRSISYEGRHRWSEAEIKKWLMAIGFGEAESTKEASWISLVNHGYIVSRDGNLVYVVLK